MMKISASRCRFSAMCLSCVINTANLTEEEKWCIYMRYRHKESKEKLGIARNALAEGFAPEIVQKITGLDLETIKGLRS